MLCSCLNVELTICRRGEVLAKIVETRRATSPLVRFVVDLTLPPDIKKSVLLKFNISNTGIKYQYY